MPDRRQRSIVRPDGTTWTEAMAENLDRDSHGNVQLSGIGALGDFLADLIKRRLGSSSSRSLRVRADTYGYLQRSFPGCISDVDAREARRVGRMAVKYSLADQPEGSVAMRRLPGASYSIETFLTHWPPSPGNPQNGSRFPRRGNNVTEAFVDYVRPLVGELPRVGSLDEV